MGEAVNLAIGSGIVSGCISAVVIVATMRADIAWLKHSVNRAHERIDQLEKKGA